MGKILAIFFLVNLINGLRIECEYKIDTTTEFPMYKCESLKLFEIEEKVLQSVNGTHVTGYGNLQVDSFSLVVDADDLSYIPNNIPVIFPNLKKFSFGFTKITKISPNDLMQLPNLEVFESRFNPILSLPGNLFNRNPKLQEVRFYGSLKFSPSKNDSISEIGQNLLGNLNQLTTVIFMSHYCIESEIALNRSEVIALNDRIHLLCPSSPEPTETSTIEALTSTIANQQTTTSGQTKHPSELCISLIILVFFRIILWNDI